MRILIAEFGQETNSFSPTISTLDYFKAGNFREGEAFLKQAFASRGAISGFLNAVKPYSNDIVCGLGMYAPSSGGLVSHDVVEMFIQDTQKRIQEVKPDVLLLSMHGATQSTECDDVCGLIAQTAREAAGPSCIIAVSSDMHANVTDRELQHIDFVCGYQTYPHRDAYETCFRAATLAMRRWQGEELYVATMYLPMIVPASGYNTNEGPFARLIARAKALVSDGKIEDFTVFQMQPWLDVADAGSRVIVVAKTPEAAKEHVYSLAQEQFSHRKEFWPKLWSVEEVIKIAEQNTTGQPVVLVDASDSAGAGSRGDSVDVICKLLESKTQIRAASTVCDPEAVKKAIEVGVGNRATFTFGAKFTPNMPGPVTVEATVQSIHEGFFEVEESANRGARRTMGTSAVIRFGSIEVILCTMASGSGDTQLYRHFGIEPTFFDLVVVKANTSFRAAYSKITSLMYVADTAGPATANLLSLPYRRIPKAFYPFSDMDDYQLESPWLLSYSAD